MAKTLAIIFGVIFVLVGLLGLLVPNPLVGVNGIFLTNSAHDLVHLLVGLVLLAIAFWAPMQSSLWLKIFGVVYLLVFLLGILMGSPILGFIEINAADNWLHLVLGLVLLAGGIWAKDSTMAPAGAPAPMQRPM